jgi:hypothetical protein
MPKRPADEFDAALPEVWQDALMDRSIPKGLTCLKLG